MSLCSCVRSCVCVCVRATPCAVFTYVWLHTHIYQCVQATPQMVLVEGNKVQSNTFIRGQCRTITQIR